MSTFYVHGLMGFICVGAQDPDDGIMVLSQAIRKYPTIWGPGGGPAVEMSEFGGRKGGPGWRRAMWHATWGCGCCTPIIISAPESDLDQNKQKTQQNPANAKIFSPAASSNKTAPPCPEFLHATLLPATKVLRNGP